MSTAIPLSDLSHLTLPSNYKVQSFEFEDQNALVDVYKSLYLEQSVDRKALAKTINKYSSVIIESQSHSLRSERIYASWAAADQEALVLIQFFAGHVLYYFLHSITLNGKCVQNVFACVLRHKPDENPDRLKLNDFSAHGLSCFLPVQRIYCRFAAAETQFEGKNRIVTVPRTANTSRS